MADRAGEAQARGVGEPEERGSEEIRQEIAARQESIARTVGKLNERLREQIDWRDAVHRHPLLTLGIASGLGFLAARVLRRPKPPAERVATAMVEAVEDVSDSLRDAIEGLAPGRSATRGILEAVAVAAAGKAAASFSSSARREALRATALQVATQVAAQAATAFAESRRRRRSSGRSGEQEGTSGAGAEARSSAGAAGMVKAPDKPTPTGVAGLGI